MTVQDEQERRELLRNLRGPGSRTNLAHNLGLGHKIKGVGIEKKINSYLF